MLQVGVIGCGYWGPNIVRNLEELATAQVVAISDLNPERLAGIQRRYPAIRTTTAYRELLNDPVIEAVAIATPVSTHFHLALEALEAGKHVLVEKPMATTSAEAECLIREAERRGLVLMVDHTFIYTGAVRKIKELLDSRQLGNLYYFKSERVNLGLFQHDVNVLWDLAVHDLAILDYLVGLEPEVITAFGDAHMPNRPVDIAFLTMSFADRFVAHIHLNWLAPVKRREIVLVGDRKAVIFNDIEPSEKVRIYDCGVEVSPGGVGVQGANPVPLMPPLIYRKGDVWTPRIDLTEALNTEMQHFVECVRTGGRPLSDGASGLRVIRVLEAASRSMAEQGAPVWLLTAAS